MLLHEITIHLIKIAQIDTNGIITALYMVITYVQNNARVPDQNGVSQASYIVKIHLSGRKTSKYMCT